MQGDPGGRGAPPRCAAAVPPPRRRLQELGVAEMTARAVAMPRAAQESAASGRCPPAACAPLGADMNTDARCWCARCTRVRAANLQELVYKQGQAGVQKASVTLIFDNTDTENSPLGYEQNTEITVTRQVREYVRAERPRRCAWFGPESPP